MQRIKISTILYIFSLSFSNVYAKNLVPASLADPHYTKVGFFDIHVCNWPDRELFFLALFSTRMADKISKIELYTPEGTRLGEIKTDKYRLILKKGKPEKRVFISQISIPKDASNGWYRSIVTTKNGTQYEAKDFVVPTRMGFANDIYPKNETELNEVPKKLSWHAVPGAKYYKVFIKDYWTKNKIYESKLLSSPKLVLPKGLIKKRNDYEWRIHVRDDNKNVLLGDFNHGSLNFPSSFSIK